MGWVEGRDGEERGYRLSCELGMRDGLLRDG